MCCSSTDRDRQPGWVLVSGPSNSGKTTLIEKLIPRLRARGISVGTIKHAHHGFELDQHGKDSWRHAQAGADVVAVIAPGRAAWLMHTPQELSLADALTPMQGRVGLVLIEGYKLSQGPRVALQPGSEFRLQQDCSEFRVGVRVLELSTEEIEYLVDFCQGHSR